MSQLAMQMFSIYDEMTDAFRFYGDVEMFASMVEIEQELEDLIGGFFEGKNQNDLEARAIATFINEFVVDFIRYNNQLGNDLKLNFKIRFPTWVRVS